MATVYKTVDGRKIEDFLGGNLDVQVAVGKYAFEIKALADVNLIEHKREGDSFVEATKGSGSGQNSGWDVTLNDTRGDVDAFNIEKGRGIQFFDKVTGLPRGQMEPLDILKDAVQAVADRHRSELRGG